jgi:hypothetical protein
LFSQLQSDSFVFQEAKRHAHTKEKKDTAAARPIEKGRCFIQFCWLAAGGRLDIYFGFQNPAFAALILPPNEMKKKLL